MRTAPFHFPDIIFLFLAFFSIRINGLINKLGSLYNENHWQGMQTYFPLFTSNLCQGECIIKLKPEASVADQRQSNKSAAWRLQRKRLNGFMLSKARVCVSQSVAAMNQTDSTASLAPQLISDLSESARAGFWLEPAESFARSAARISSLLRSFHIG